MVQRGRGIHVPAAHRLFLLPMSTTQPPPPPPKNQFQLHYDIFAEPVDPNEARAIHEHAKRVFHDLETSTSKFEHSTLGTRRRHSTKKPRNDTTNGSLNASTPSNDTSSCSLNKSTLMPSIDQRNKKKLQGGGLNIDDDNDDAQDARLSFTHANNYNPFLGTTDGNKMDNNSRREETDRRSTYDRRCSPFFQADNNNPFAVKSFKTDSNPFAVNSFKPHVDVSYRESLLSFVKELGPKAKMVAARKLQSAELLDIGAGSGGAASPGLFLIRGNSLPTTTEPPPMPAPAPPQPQSTTATTAKSDMGAASSPALFFRDYSLPPTTKPPPIPYKPLPLHPQSTMTTTGRRSDIGGASSPGLFFRDYSLPSTTEPPTLAHKPLPLQPQSTMTTTTARRSDTGGASSPGLFFRDYSLPLTTEQQTPPPHRPLPLQPQPTMATTRRAEMGGAASPGLFFRNYSLPSATTEPPPLPPQPQPTKTPPRKNETREAAGGAVNGPHPTEENVRPVILALEYPHANHALESRKDKIKRNRLRSTHNDESIDRGHSQAVVDSGQKHKKPKSPPPTSQPESAAAAPSFPFDMCFLKAKLDRMIVQRPPIGMKGDNKFATGLQSWTSNPILARQWF